MVLFNNSKGSCFNGFKLCEYDNGVSYAFIKKSGMESSTCIDFSCLDKEKWFSRFYSLNINDFFKEQRLKLSDKAMPR